MRIVACCLAIASLSACATSEPAAVPVAGRDIPCLEGQISMHGFGMARATAACKVTTPDLTGSERLQQLALLEHVPFAVRPKADLFLKRQAAGMPRREGEDVIIGSAIPEPASINANNPEWTPFFHPVVSSGVP